MKGIRLLDFNIFRSSYITCIQYISAYVKAFIQPKPINTMSTHFQFWYWFIENYQHLKNQQGIINLWGFFWGYTKLNNYCPDLSFIIKYPSKNGKKYKLIVTAGGDTIPPIKIKYLSNTALKMLNWTFAAKFQPMCNLSNINDGTAPLYEFGDFKIKISDLMFAPINYCPIVEGFDIVVYVHDFWKNPQELLYEAVTILLEDLLGNHLVYSKINRLTLEQIPKNTDALIPIHDMEYFFRTFTLE